MKYLNRLLLVLASASFFYASAQAQNAGTVSNHAVPIGRGPGVTGFTSVSPGTAGIPFVSNGASLDPSYQVLGLSGGGTGQTTRAAALNALMPTPTRTGDVVYWNGTQFVSLAGNNSGTLCLSENGSGTPSWIACGGALTVGSAVISGGTNGRPLYDNAGVLGEYAQIPASFGGTGVDNSTNTAGDILSSSANNGTFAARSLNALCTLAPSACTLALGYTSIAWYGAKCDGIFQSNQNVDQPSTNLSITSGSPNLTSSGSTFTSADVGKRIYVPGAGAAGAGLSTTILAFVSATQVTLSTNASTTITTLAATNAAPFAYGTDDTTAIQNAINATPNGGTLFIPGKTTGCVIRQQGANAYALLQNRPFNVRGTGHFSNLMTFPDTPSTVDNFLVNNTTGGDWIGTVWDGFGISATTSFVPATFLMNPRFGKRGLAFVDITASTNFPQILISNITIGESGNDYSLYVGNPTSSASQGVQIIRNRINGGVHLDHVSDSFLLKDNFFYGATTKGGLFEFVSGAGSFLFANNNVTWTGCTIIESGSKPVIKDNYFEEVVNGSNCARAAVVDFNGGLSAIVSPTFTGNIVNASVSTATLVRFNNHTEGIFGDNALIEGTVRTFVTSTTGLTCSAPNFWSGSGTHFSTSLRSPNPWAC